jgi:hypothetical protein
MLCDQASASEFRRRSTARLASLVPKSSKPIKAPGYEAVDLPQVSLEWVLIGYIQFITDLIINWIYPIKTHSRETWGKSNQQPEPGPLWGPPELGPGDEDGDFHTDVTDG